MIHLYTLSFEHWFSYWEFRCQFENTKFSRSSPSPRGQNPGNDTSKYLVRPVKREPKYNEDLIIERTSYYVSQPIITWTICHVRKLLINNLFSPHTLSSKSSIWFSLSNVICIKIKWITKINSRTTQTFTFH